MIAIPFRLATIDGVLSFFSTTTLFGTPVDITVSELAIEAFLPADAETAADHAADRVAAAGPRQPLAAQPGVTISSSGRGGQQHAVDPLQRGKGLTPCLQESVRFRAAARPGWRRSRHRYAGRRSAAGSRLASGGRATGIRRPSKMTDNVPSGRMPRARVSPSISRHTGTAPFGAWVGRMRRVVGAHAIHDMHRHVAGQRLGQRGAFGCVHRLQPGAQSAGRAARDADHSGSARPSR